MVKVKTLKSGELCFLTDTGTAVIELVMDQQAKVMDELRLILAVKWSEAIRPTDIEIRNFLSYKSYCVGVNTPNSTLNWYGYYGEFNPRLAINNYILAASSSIPVIQQEFGSAFNTEDFIIAMDEILKLPDVALINDWSCELHKEITNNRTIRSEKEAVH